MELFQELKDLMVKRRKASYRKDWDSVNKLKQKSFELTRELRGLWCDSQTSLVKCPACHGEGSFGDGWNEEILDCRLCLGLGFVDRERQMEYVRSFIGMEKKLREQICAKKQID